VILVNEGNIRYSHRVRIARNQEPALGNEGLPKLLLSNVWAQERMKITANSTVFPTGGYHFPEFSRDQLVPIAVIGHP